MAGQKLSARQKMINMMYLVLTALLALNVSAEILDAFESMRRSLETTTQAYTNKNEERVRHFKEAVEKERKTGNESNTYLLDVVAEVTDRAKKTMSFLNQISEELETIGHRDDVSGEIMRKDEIDANYRFWLGNQDMSNGGRGNGKAKELREKLEGYVKWGNELFAKFDTVNKSNHFASVTMEPSQDSRITNAESKSKTWEYHTFHGKPVVADLAMVEKFKMEVKEMESEMLSLAEKMFTGTIYKVDKLVAMEAPGALVVAAGMKYETKLMVGLYSQNLKPEFLGSGIRTNEDGNTATMTLTANGSVIPKGASEGVQRYRAMIKVPRADGKYEELPIEGEFKVRRPEVVVRSKALQLLYKDCGNEVTVDVPALGDSYNPDFSKSRGGQAIRSQKSRKDITIVPKSREFILSVYSNTNGQNIKLEDIKYNVIKPPPPRLAIFVNGKEHDGKSPISKRQKVTVKLIADPEFKRTLPKDARYKVSSVKLLYQDGLVAPRTIDSKTGNIMSGIDMSLYKGEIRNARAGSRIFFEVEGVKRVNFLNQTVVVDMPRIDLLKGAVIR